MVRLFALILCLLPATGWAEKWSLVPGETRVEVDVAYLGNTVTLKFPTLVGDVLFDEAAPEGAKASIAVGTRDVDTGLGLVNNFVKSEDYLDAAAHPQIDFRLDRLVRTSDQTADIFGRMTLRGVTQPVAFKAKVFRYGPTPGAADRFDAGFDLTGSVDRRQFGQTAGLPQVAPILPVRIRLLMRSDG